MTDFLLYMIAQLLIIIARKDMMPSTHMFDETQKILNQIDKRWMDSK